MLAVQDRGTRAHVAGSSACTSVHVPPSRGRVPVCVYVSTSRARCACVAVACPKAPRAGPIHAHKGHSLHPLLQRACASERARTHLSLCRRPRSPPPLTHTSPTGRWCAACPEVAAAVAARAAQHSTARARARHGHTRKQSRHVNQIHHATRTLANQDHRTVPHHTAPARSSPFLVHPAR